MISYAEPALESGDERISGVTQKIQPFHFREKPLFFTFLGTLLSLDRNESISIELDQSNNQIIAKKN